VELSGFGGTAPGAKEAEEKGAPLAWPSAGEGPGAPAAGPPQLAQGDGSYWWPKEGPTWPRGGAGPVAGQDGRGAAPWDSWPVPTAYRGPGREQGTDGYGAGREQRPGTLGPAGARPAANRGRRPQATTSRLRRAWQRFVGALVAIGAFLAKFGALLIKLKYVGLVLSMFVSVLAYTLFFGWSFAVGFVLLIFVHEMGHVLVLRRQGVPASAPLFIPFLGAFVNMRQMPRNAYQEAVSGLAGPYFGTAASAAVALWGHAVGSNFLLQLGAVGFLLNLFNLLPVLPLDGGRAAAALHPVLWLVGLVALLAWEVFNPSPVALIIIVLGGFELYRRWTRRNSPAARAYHALSARQRVAVALMYLFVVAVAIVGFQLTYVARTL
jgi:Zn-dependent protease